MSGGFGGSLARPGARRMLGAVATTVSVQTQFPFNPQNHKHIRTVQGKMKWSPAASLAALVAALCGCVVCVFVRALCLPLHLVMPR